MRGLPIPIIDVKNNNGTYTKAFGGHIAITVEALDTPLTFDLRFAEDHTSGTARVVDITFNNSTSAAARVYWVHPAGREVLYQVLGPGASYIQQSLADHMWQVRGVEPSKPLGRHIVGTDAWQMYGITDA